MRKKNHAIYLMLNDDDYALIKKKINESGRTICDYMTDSAINCEVTSQNKINELKELNRNIYEFDRQIKAIDNNVNQIAKKVNATNESITSRELNWIKQSINQIRNEETELWQQIRQRSMD